MVRQSLFCITYTFHFWGYVQLNGLGFFVADANVLLQKRSYRYKDNHMTVSHSMSLKSLRSPVIPLNEYRRPTGNVKKGYIC
jgi:hypothetical protein